jgi:hypothetical protein
MTDRGEDRGPIHLHCGDCAGAVARRAGLPGEVWVWRDSSAVGPCVIDPDTHRRLRAEWWDVAVAEMDLARDLPADREMVLWFGPDPWEQTALVEVLTGTPATALSVVVLDDAVGVMDPADLRARFEARRDAGDLPATIAGLWRDFCIDDRATLRAWIGRLRGEARLPHLPAALDRVLEDREDGRTARQVRALVDQGVRDLPELMRRLHALEGPKHGVWYGDAIVRRLRDERLREEARPSDQHHWQ